MKIILTTITNKRIKINNVAKTTGGIDFRNNPNFNVELDNGGIIYFNPSNIVSLEFIP